jgi:hypothetical protein
MVGDQGVGDADLLQHAAECIPLGLGMPPRVAVMIEQLAGGHPAKVLNAISNCHCVSSLKSQISSRPLIRFLQDETESGDL